MVFQVFLLYIVCCLYLYCVVKKRRQKGILAPPDLPGKLPLIGHAHLIWGDSIHTWKFVSWAGKETVKLGGVAMLAIGPKNGYAISDPDDCITVANACMQKEYFYGFASPWLGEGFLMGSVPVWKKHRSLFNPAFTQHILIGFMTTFNNQSRQLVQKWMNKKGPFRHNLDLSLNNLETICNTALGIKVDDFSTISGEYENALEEILNVLTDRFRKIWLHNDFLYKWSNLKKRQDKAVKVLHKMSYMALQKKKLKSFKPNESEGSPNPDNFKSFIDVMSEFAIANDLIYSDEDIREDIDNIIFAGHDTVSTAMTLTLLLLGSYSGIQEKAFNEIHEIFGDSTRDVTKEDLVQLVYLEAVIKETLRLYPVGPILARCVTNNVKLKNYTIKAGSSCFLIFSGLHLHPIWGSDADQFRPERWLDGTLKSKSNAFGAFSLGRRSCIGKSYAIMSLKTTLVHVLRQYRISGDVTRLVLKLEALLKPVSGFEISLESRT